MSNLEAKFEALETQLTTHNTAIVEALDSILTALGAPPPGPTTTLADISTQLSSLNDSIGGILTANATYYAASLDVLGLINTNLDTMLNNNSLNAQRLLAAIYATSCACPTPTSILPLPLDTTPTSLADSDKCKRIQFYISLFGRWLDKIANYGNSASFVTGDTIGTLLGIAASEVGLVATGAEVGAAAGPPGIVVGAVVGLIVGAIFTFGGSVLIDYAAQFNAPTLKAALLAAMFAATNADEGNAAFHSVIGANFSTIPAGIINALWWASWSNDVYSGTPTVDDSAFDGSICTTDIPCFELSSVGWGTNSNGTWYGIEWGSYSTINTWTVAGGLTFRELTDMVLNGYVITIVSFGDTIYRTYNRTGSATGWSPSHTIDLSSGNLSIYSNAPFTIEVCPAGS